MVDKPPGFKANMSQEEVNALRAKAYELGHISFDKRTLLRMEEVKLSTTEVDSAVCNGEITSHEVSPNRTELRLEVRGTQGDARQFVVVVWTDLKHNLYICDIREYKPIALQQAPGMKQ